MTEIKLGNTEGYEPMIDMLMGVILGAFVLGLAIGLIIGYFAWG